MVLKVIMKVPDFTLPDNQGTDITLSNFKTKDILFYIFIRMIIPKDVPLKLLILETIMRNKKNLLIIIVIMIFRLKN